MALRLPAARRRGRLFGRTHANNLKENNSQENYAVEGKSHNKLPVHLDVPSPNTQISIPKNTGVDVHSVGESPFSECRLRRSLARSKRDPELLGWMPLTKCLKFLFSMLYPIASRHLKRRHANYLEIETK
jgi:hypothetical protein